MRQINQVKVENTFPETPKINGMAHDFKITKPQDDLENEAELLQQKEAELNNAKKAFEEKQKAKQLAIIEEKTRLYNRTKVEAENFRDLVLSFTDPHDKEKYLALAKQSEKEAEKLAKELGIWTDTDQETTLQPRKLGVLSTTKAIGVLIACFVISCLITYLIGQDALKDPLNPMGQSIIKNGPIRAMVAFTLTFLTVLVAIFFKWLLFNPFFRLWHNRINTERNLDSLISEAPAWALLASLLGLFYLLTSLFATYYTTLFA